MTRDTPAASVSTFQDGGGVRFRVQKRSGLITIELIFEVRVWLVHEIVNSGRSVRSQSRQYRASDEAEAEYFRLVEKYTTS